jgi:hypothetical protein
LRGNIWVDAHSFQLRRAEGEPARTPSWWLRDVRIALPYSDVSGMWLQTALEATATVRILAQYTVVSRDMKYQLSELVAAGPPTQIKLKKPKRDGSHRHPVTQVPKPSKENATS